MALYFSSRPEPNCAASLPSPKFFFHFRSQTVPTLEKHHFLTFPHYPHLNQANRIDFEKFSSRGTFHRDRNPTARLHSHRQNFFFTFGRKRSLHPGNTGEHNFPKFRHHPNLN